jgi:hypothetical protein
LNHDFRRPYQPEGAQTAEQALTVPRDLKIQTVVERKRKMAAQEQLRKAMNSQGKNPYLMLGAPPRH